MWRGACLAWGDGEVGGEPLAHELRRELLEREDLLEHLQHRPRDVPARCLDLAHDRCCRDDRGGGQVDGEVGTGAPMGGGRLLGEHQLGAKG